MMSYLEMLHELEHDIWLYGLDVVGGYADLYSSISRYYWMRKKWYAATRG